MLPTNTWTPYDEPGHEYYLSTDSTKYTENLQSCEDLGGELAKITGVAMAFAFVRGLRALSFRINLVHLQGSKYINRFQCLDNQLCTIDLDFCYIKTKKSNLARSFLVIASTA